MKEEFVLREADLQELRNAEEYLKGEAGRYDIEDMFNDESEKFDRRKFPKITCGYCEHKFNPFYYNNLVKGEWDWVWQGDSHKEPESRCKIDCPKCKKQIRFTQYIGQ